MAYQTVTNHPKLYPYTSIMASPYNCDPTGVLDCAAGIEALKAAYSNEMVMLIPKGTFRIATNLTLPVGLVIDPSSAGKLQVVSGATLTVLSPVSADLRSRCFSTTGTGVLNIAGQGQTVYPETFGAIGDGVTDDSAAVTAAIASLSATGGTVVFQNNYKIDTGQIPLTADITLQGLPGNLIDTSAIGGRLFRAFGMIGTQLTGNPAAPGTNAEEALTVNAVAGDTVLSVASTTGFAAGDYVQVWSNGLLNADHKQGEMAQIASLVADTSITLKAPLLFGYTTANSATIGKVTWVENITIEGLNVIGAAVSDNSEFINAYMLKNFRVRACNFKYMNYSAIQLYNSVDVKISDTHFEDALNDGTGYGVSVSCSCKGVTVSNCTSRNVRHAVSGGGSANGYGGPRDVTVTGCTFDLCRDSGVDCHAGFDNWTIVGNTISGHDGATNKKGIGLRGGSAVVAGNIISNLDGGVGIALTHASTNEMHYTVDGNFINNPGADAGIGVQLSLTTVDVYSNIKGLSITNNKISSCFDAIYIECITGTAMTGFNISGNNCRYVKQYGLLLEHGDYSMVNIADNVFIGRGVADSRAIYIIDGAISSVNITGGIINNFDNGFYIIAVTGQHFTDINISDVVLKTITAKALRADYVDSLTVKGNTVTTVAEYGYYIVNCTDVDISNNNFKAVTNAIVLASTNDIVRIVDNSFYNCVTYGIRNTGTLTNQYIKDNRFIGTLPATALIDSSVARAFAGGDLTPSVKGGWLFLTGGADAYTDFDDGYEGQEITIIAEHAATVTDGTNIFLAGSANWVMTITDTLTLLCKADNKWYEKCRSDNAA